MNSHFADYLKKKNIPFLIIDDEDWGKKDNVNNFFNLVSKKILKYKPKFIWNFIGTHSKI